MAMGSSDNLRYLVGLNRVLIVSSWDFYSR